jgi:hypothetical protein
LIRSPFSAIAAFESECWASPSFKGSEFLGRQALKLELKITRVKKIFIGFFCGLSILEKHRSLELHDRFRNRISPIQRKAHPEFGYRRE